MPGYPLFQSQSLTTSIKVISFLSTKMMFTILSSSLSVQFPTGAFVYIHRNQSSNRSTVNKVPIGKNKVPGR